MTFHLFAAESVECLSCQTKFIPFEEHQPCPQCQALAAIHYPFVDEVAVAMRIHQEEYGSFQSPAYFVGSQAESYFHYTSGWMDSVESESSGEERGSAIDAVLDRVDWGEMEYMKNYFRRLLVLVAARLDSDEGAAK